LPWSRCLGRTRVAPGPPDGEVTPVKVLRQEDPAG
jgi:hypothetical protein